MGDETYRQRKDREFEQKMRGISQAQHLLRMLLVQQANPVEVEQKMRQLDDMRESLIRKRQYAILMAAEKRKMQPPTGHVPEQTEKWRIVSQADAKRLVNEGASVRFNVVGTVCAVKERE